MGEHHARASDLAIISISDQGTILTANPRAEELFGYAVGELVGKDISCLVPGDLLGRHQQLRKAYLDDPKRRFMALQRPFPALRKDGERVWIKGSLSPMKDVTGVVVTCVFQEHAGP